MMTLTKCGAVGNLLTLRMMIEMERFDFSPGG